MSKRGRRKSEVGRVASSAMDKTLSVEIERRERHAMYGKIMKRVTTCKAHDENNEANVGDKVEIVSCRPLSKSKRWRLVKVLERSQTQ